jgi:ribosomal protein S18 acetylase RimI-like enzyme
MPGTHLRVEMVGPEFSALVRQLTLDAFIEYKDVLEPPTGVLSETLAEVQQSIAEHGAAVAWIGETAVGSARFEVNPDHFYVGRLAVLPAYRRLGVAAALMEIAEIRARELGLPAIQVEVRSALPRNITFFKRLGFVHLETKPHPRSPTATSELLAKLV